MGAKTANRVIRAHKAVDNIFAEYLMSLTEDEFTAHLKRQFGDRDRESLADAMRASNISEDQIPFFLDMIYGEQVPL